MKKIYHIIYSILIAASLLIGIYLLTRPSYSVAFVRSGDVLKKYIGFREAQGYIDNRTQQAQYIVDSLYNKYVALLEEYNKLEQNLSSTEKKKKKQEIEHNKAAYEEYTKKAEDGLSTENDKILQGALNQVNSYVKEYAEKHHINLVIGVTMSGNVLYGADAIDITEEIIEGLNKNYKK